MSILLTSTISASLVGDNFWIKEAYAAEKIYAVVWDNGSGGSVRTYTISTDGGTITPLSAEVEFDSTGFINGNVVQMDSDTWVAAYRDGNTFMRVTTFEIDSAGAITTKSTLLADGTISNYVSVQKRDDDTAVVVYASDNVAAPILVKTFTIGSDSSISAAVATEQIDANNNDNFESFKVDDNTFGILMKDNTSGAQQMRTFDVSADGATVDNFAQTTDPAFTGTTSSTQTPISVDADTFTFMFKDGSNTGSLRTVDISSSGAITVAGTETKTFDIVALGSLGEHGQMFSIGNNIFGIAYSDANNDGTIKTVTIADNADITDGGGSAATILGTLEYADAESAREPAIINVSGTTYALVYDDEGTTSTKIRTVSISADGVTMSNIATATVDAANGEGQDIFYVGDAASTTTSSGNSGDSTAPTLGTSSTGQKMIDNGFVYNNNPVDVKNFRTDYPLVRTPVGEKNTLDLKIFENQGMNALKFVSVHFGVPQINAQGEAIVTYYPTTGEMKVYDPNNLLGEVDISLKPVKCKDTSDKESCVNVSLDHTFNEAPLHDIVRVTVADKKLNHADVFFNDGVEVFGDSLNPANTAQIAAHGSDRGIVELTQIDRALEIWTDQNDNTWTKNSMGTFIQQPLEEFVHPDDNPVGKNGYKRINPHFDTYKSGQELVANQIWDSNSIESQLPDSIQTPAYGAILGENNPALRINDIALQKDMLKQIERANQKLNAPNQSLEDFGIFIEFSYTLIEIPDEILFVKDISGIKDQKLSDIVKALEMHEQKIIQEKLSK